MKEQYQYVMNYLIDLYEQVKENQIDDLVVPKKFLSEIHMEE